MITKQTIIECADFLIWHLMNKFPGAIISMRLNVQPRPGTEHVGQSPMEGSYITEEPILRGTWLIGVGSRFKDGRLMREEADKMVERIFMTHGVFIQYLIVEEDDAQS